MRQYELTYQKSERVLTPERYAVPDGEGWKRYVYVRDVQGNIRAVVDAGNAVAEQTDYYPYGMPMADVNSASVQPFKFGGKELEREGGADWRAGSTSPSAASPLPTPSASRRPKSPPTPTAPPIPSTSSTQREKAQLSLT